MFKLTSLALVTIGVLTGIADAQQWSSCFPPMDVPRTVFAACVDPCGNIYAIGGAIGGPGSATSTVSVLTYDGSAYAPAWSTYTPLRTARMNLAAVCVNGFLYAIGGSDSSDVHLATVERLDIRSATPTWTAGPPMRHVRSALAATVDKLGRIWVVGGSDTAGDIVEIYDPARPELGWTFGPSLNVARGPCCSPGAVTDEKGRIYVIGGGEIGEPSTLHLPDVERIDACLSGATWEFVASLPRPVSNTGTAALGADGRIYVAGGWLPGYTNRVIRYDPNADAWSDWVPLNQARNNGSIVLSATGQVIVMGGDGPTGSVECLNAPCGAAPPLGREILMDADGNGTINGIDLAMLLAQWGACSP